MHLVVKGLTHKTAPVELREKLCIPEDQLRTALASLKACDGVSECVILSTCNRTEVYACSARRADDETIVQWLGQFCGVAPDEFRPHLYSQAGHKAVDHLFRVAAGIDSMVVGEAQVLGQVKSAYMAAKEAAATGAVLNSLFQQSINVGKRARAETDIGKGAFSVGSVAVQLARSIFEDLKGCTVLIVGAGKIGELAVTHLTSCGATRLLVANRTYERAAELAARFDGEAVRFEDIPSVLWTAEIVITSTGAQEPVITRQIVSAAMRSRRGRPMFLIDLAVPRDIAPEVADIDNVFVYNIDNLRAVVGAGAAHRQAEVEKVESIVAQEVEQFMVHFRTLDAVPVITALREKFEGIRLQEIEKLRARLKDLTPEELEAIHATTRSIVNKICHTPMIQIKEAAIGDESVKLETICELFGICPMEEQTDE